MKRLLLSLMTILMPMVVSAYDFEVDGMCFTITSAENLTVKVDCKDAPSGNKSTYYSGIVTIPEKVTFGNNTFNVTGIGKNAFYGSVAETVIIPNSVKVLEEGCFRWSNIKYITLPGSIESIPQYSFWSCYSLVNVTLEEGIKYLGEGCLAGGSPIGTLKIPSSMEKINSTAIDSKTRNIIFKGNAPLLEKDQTVLFNLKGKTAYVQAGMIENFKSEGWNFETFIEYDEGIADVYPTFIINDIVYKPTSLVGNYNVSAIGYEANPTNIIIPKSVEYDGVSYSVSSISQSAFKDCESIGRLSIASSVKEIEDYAFTNCINLNKISLEDGIERIGSSVFNNTGITKIVLPLTVVSIGEEAFAGCQGLNEVYSKIQNPFDAEDVFSMLTTMTGTLYVPEGTKSLYETKLGWKDFTTIIETNDFDVKDEYNMTYLVDGNEYKSYEIEEGSSITPEPAPTKEGYTFSGWSDIPETMPANDVTITGTFSINKYNLIYKVDGEEYKTVPIEYNSAITPETAPTKEGYSFSGWSSIPATMPANDITITGTFSINKYKLTYFLDGNVYQTSEVKYGTTLTPIEAPYVEYYYTFSGWSEVPETMPAHNVDITGTKVPKKYTLEYQLRDPVSGTYSTYKSLEVKYGATITPEPAPTKEGYSFSGWSDIPSTMPSYKVTIYGRFTVNSYTLTYQIDGKTYKSYTQKYGSTITQEIAPTKDGFTFSGWGEVPANMPARDVTINGSYTKNPTTNVTYPADWNLTEWSEETISNLESDTKWSKYDYKYSYQGSCPKDESIELTANGVKIKETAGVEFAVSNCTLFNISTKAGGLSDVYIQVYEPTNFFFVLKNMKRGQKVSIDFESSDFYTDNDLFPQPVGAVKMTDSPKTRAIRSKSSVAEYVVSNDGDVRFNVNADKFFYLYNVDVTAVSDTYLSYISNPNGINNQIDCYLYWNGNSSSAIGPWGSSYARGADVRIENKSNQTMTITRIELYSGTTSLKTVTDQNGDIASGDFKEFSFDVSSSVEMPETLPWMEVYYDVNGASYIKKFVSDGKGASTGIIEHRVDGEADEHEDIYTIDGKKLSSYPTKKGLYVRKGKKFVVK